MKKPRTVKTRIEKLLRVLNCTHAELAKALNIDRTYIGKLIDGLVPGKFLYQHIVNFYDTTMSKRKENQVNTNKK